jgi:hypothetical protein
MVPRTTFYDLPRELRTKVYAYAIVRPDTKPLRVNPTEGQDTTDLAIGLLGTSALIRKEASSVFFGSNTFYLDCTHLDRGRLEQQVRRIGPSNLHMVRSYTFGYNLGELCNDSKSLQERDKTLLGLRLVSKVPYHTLEGLHVGVTDVKEAAVAYFLQDMFLYRNVRSLAVRDILDVAAFIHLCGHSWTEGRRDASAR